MSGVGMPSGPPPPAAAGRLWAAVVTYRRPDELAVMLHAVGRASMAVHQLVVVDNGSDPAVEQLAQGAGARYVDSGENLGPAGGIAVAMHVVLEQATDDDWLLLLDDDDPPPDDQAIANLWEFAHTCLADDPGTGAVGHTGGVYRRRLGIWRRPEDAELVGRVSVDVIGGGHLPMYRCAVIREVGVFDRSLFFGFEEGEYGMRLRTRGFSMYADGPRWLTHRRALGVAETPSKQVRTALTTAAWRRYYGVRNATIVAKRYAAPWAPLVVAAGGAWRGMRALQRTGRPRDEWLLPLRGARDGLLSRTGRTINPQNSTK